MLWRLKYHFLESLFSHLSVPQILNNKYGYIGIPSLCLCSYGEVPKSGHLMTTLVEYEKVFSSFYEGMDLEMGDY